MFGPVIAQDIKPKMENSDIKFDIQKSWYMLKDMTSELAMFDTLIAQELRPNIAYSYMKFDIS